MSKNALLLLIGMALLLGCGVARDSSRLASTTREAVISSYAKAWTDRADGGLDFRLSSHPEARYLLLPPPSYDPRQKYELWVAVFGEPSTSEQALAEWWHFARARHAFLLAPHGSTRFGPRSSLARWNLAKDPEEIVDMVAEVSQRYRIDPTRMAIMGSSSGGQVTWSIVSHHPDLFRFVAVNCAPWQDTSPWIDRKGLWQAGKHMNAFYGMGKADPAYVASNFQLAEKRLQDAGFKLSSLQLDGVKHDPRPFLDAADRLYGQLKVEWGEEPRGWTLPLAGIWKAKLLVKLAPLHHGKHNLPQADPGISTAASGALGETFDDRSWQDVNVPDDWDQYAGDWKNWDGEAVFRKTFVVPPELAGHDLCVRLGYIDDTDETYMNGQRIGATEEGDPFWEYAPRIYKVPGKLVHAGKNCLAVRIFDRWAGGGIGGVNPEGISIASR